jgi:hypothetical protein
MKENNVEKLIELSENGVEIAIVGPGKYIFNWSVCFAKEINGVKLEVRVFAAEINTAIDKAYAKWYGNIPAELKMLSIEHVPQAPRSDTDIPF